MTEHYLDRLARTINENWDSPALTDFYLTEDGTAQDTSRGNHYTYGEMYAEICRVAELLTSLGLQKGDHIAICGANSAHWVIAYLAIAKMQGVSVTVMHTIMPDEIARLVDFSDAKALFTDSDLWAELKAQSLPQIENVISLDDWSVLLGENQIINHQSKIINGECRFDPIEPDSLAMICFTTGSSSSPKCAMLSYRNITTSVIETARVYIINNRRKKKKVIALLPLSHVFGWGANHIPLIYGVPIYLFHQNYCMEKLLKSIIIIQPYCIFTIPLLITKLREIKNKQIIYAFTKELDFLIVGGGCLSSRERREFISSGIPLTLVYGMTETTAPISLSLPSDKNESSGCVIPSLSCRISPAGEILVKGENVMLGYYKDPEATAAKIDKDGWLHTGDKGHLDEDGYLYVEGRLEQDMIVLPNGENIHPEDIERKINALPEVSESIVLARDGKLVAIVVAQITNDQSSMTNTDLRRIILRNVNPLLPLYSQLYDVEITDTPLQKTEKQTIKRYLYK